jgi:phosphoglycolate phosphatase
LQHILFDLDGTLSDPKIGIIRSILYALEQLKVAAPPEAQLVQYIGPPLREGFSHLLGIPETDDRVEQAVKFYRERFSQVGLFENKIYNGIPELLQKLCDRNKQLYIATSKPQVYAQQILVHFQLAHFFQGIYGSELDGTRQNKAELIAYLLEQEAIPAESAVMVGDRKHDIEGGRQNHLISLGVLWGYGCDLELSEAGAHSLCYSLYDLEQALTRSNNNLHVGVAVKIIDIPAPIRALYPEDKLIFTNCLGQILTIRGLNDYGDFEFWVRDDGSDTSDPCQHTIWIDIDCIQAMDELTD